MNKKTLLVDMISGEFKVNSSSKIIDITYDKENLNYVVEYFESPFIDEMDVYQVKDLYFKDEDEHLDSDNLKGYTFYGKHWDRIRNDYFILLTKQVDRLKNESN